MQKLVELTQGLREHLNLSISLNPWPILVQRGLLFDSYPRGLVRDAEKYTLFTEHELQSATPLIIQT